MPCLPIFISLVVIDFFSWVPSTDISSVDRRVLGGCQRQGTSGHRTLPQAPSSPMTFPEGLR
ncbi:MAG: hypothetical protein MZV63_23020 [Marinilabiliales bacterium]|nr:hypothetical protein [Marinilabiliales bacterium]